MQLGDDNKWAVEQVDVAYEPKTQKPLGPNPIEGHHMWRTRKRTFYLAF